MTPLNRFQACVFYADACVNVNSYKRAEQVQMISSV